MRSEAESNNADKLEVHAGHATFSATEADLKSIPALEEVAQRDNFFSGKSCAEAIAEIRKRAEATQSKP